MNTIPIKNQTLLVVAENQSPSNPAELHWKWPEFLMNIPKPSAQSAAIERVAPNIWQIPLADGLKTLYEILNLGAQYQIPIRVLLLEDVPVWKRYAPSA
jgi:hypothetical protein